MQDNLTPDGILIKELPESPGYGVTVDGRVWSKRGKKERNGVWTELKPGHDIYGYPQLHISSAGGRRPTKKVHQLVLGAFIEKPLLGDNQVCVNHIDGNKTNNYLFNLEWVTSKINTKHATDMGLKLVGSSLSFSRISEIDTLLIRYMYTSNYGSQTVIGKIFGISQVMVSRIVLRKAWKHVG